MMQPIEVYSVGDKQYALSEQIASLTSWKAQ